MVYLFIGMVIGGTAGLFTGCLLGIGEGSR